MLAYRGVLPIGADGFGTKVYADLCDHGVLMVIRLSSATSLGLAMFLSMGLSPAMFRGVAVRCTNSGTCQSDFFSGPRSCQLGP